MEEPQWECVVVGGGAAGLAAALNLGRGRRRTLLVDAGRQSNLAATSIQGFSGHDGQDPAEFYRRSREELRVYPSVEVRKGQIVDAATTAGSGFILTSEDGSQTPSKKVILAHGMRYDYPAIPGLAEHWGRSAFQCPFCHGWESRDKRIGVLANGPVGAHGALGLTAWTEDVTLLTNGPATLDDRLRSMLSAQRIAIDERPVASVHGALTIEGVEFATGESRSLEGLLVKAVLRQPSQLAVRLGASVSPPDEMLSVEAIDVNRMGRTEVPGLFAAGDASTSTPPSMATASASGYLAGAAAVIELAAGW